MVHYDTIQLSKSPTERDGYLSGLLG